MAPKGRSRKVGSRKVDAAVKVLTQFGFQKDEVVSTIKDLIQEYGGDEGWVFIEDNGYQVLVDSILDKQNYEEKKGGGDAGQSSKERHAHNYEREIHGQNPDVVREMEGQKKRREPCYGWISEDEED
ncbi:hypothetical protein J5N97_003114 [Dioscorea zingiberensis]|uniref:WIYLD domain-containing protein n=1 Tax=Dioscorea zingiberensis TaxID=325984 RepID=A0A9D5D625_9LILI|nr:hypothetical protein J5N97_003114 [Dioscorea zingiberensis]